MTTIFLLIPDTALREAVAEQIAAAKLGPAVVAESLASLARQVDATSGGAIVIDEAAFDKKVAVWAQELAGREDKPALLRLGGAEDAHEAVTESFAKPFRLGHLITRLRYYLETAPLLRDKTVAFGPYRLEPRLRQIIRDKDEPVRLTEKETALLLFLAQKQEPATRAEILAHVWGYDERIETHTLETHIYQLRRKLEGGAADWLTCEAGAYRLARSEA